MAGIRPADLLHQAEVLAKLERKRPKQASLRRAISAAYYALFHTLCQAFGRQLMPGASRDQQARIGRALAHGSAALACKDFVGKKLPDAVVDAFPSLRPQTLPAEIRAVATAFVLLQEARHSADYGATDFTRLQTLQEINRCREALKAWAVLGGNRKKPSEPAVTCFVLWLGMRDKLIGRK